ncbi:hypothetical protein [Actinosynnema sp. NPDC023587]
MRRSGGYVLVTDATGVAVDLHRFQEPCARGRTGTTTSSAYNGNWTH